MKVPIYHGLQSEEFCTGVLSLGSCDEINTSFRVILVEVGDTDPVSRVRLVEEGNTGET